MRTRSEIIKQINNIQNDICVNGWTYYTKWQIKKMNRQEDEKNISFKYWLIYNYIK